MHEGGTRSRHGGSTGLKAGDRLQHAWREAKEEMKKVEQVNGIKKKKKERGVRVSRVKPPFSLFFMLLKGSISPDTISRIPGSLILNQNH